MNVSSVLSIGWPKLDKWHLARIMGSWGFYVHRLQLDLCPQVAVVWPKKRGILVVALNNFATLCAVWQKIVKV